MKNIDLIAEFFACRPLFRESVNLELFWKAEDIREDVYKKFRISKGFEEAVILANKAAIEFLYSENKIS